MSFNSAIVLIAILILSCSTRFIPNAKARQCLLLICSYIFYVRWAGFGFLLILVASSLMNYFLAGLLRRRLTTAVLWTGIGFNILLLGVFKYPQLVHVFDGIILPLGISFWTFQAISYLVDVYLEKEVDPSLLEFSLYLALWPTVVAGPVCRLTRMLPQLRTRTSSIREDFSIGLVRVIQGLFMKFVLAELLANGLTRGAGVVSGFDSHAGGWSGLDVWALALGYGFQLFFDFAGYSNMAIGAARLFGLRLQENFDKPYLSPSPSVFWTRWHMSLSFWIRDYVYSPLAAVRRESWWPYSALFISMVVFGFWHDAKITYIAWGLYHGALLVGHRVLQRSKRRFAFELPHPLGALLSWATTFVLILFGYVLFRANDFGQVLKMVSAVFQPATYAFANSTLPISYYGLVFWIAGAYFAYEGIAQLLGAWTTSMSRATLVAGILERKWWWLTPAFVMLLVITGLSVVGIKSTMAPVIYALF
jgi:alginate O-acetyltransferase complex protein AlgI